MLDRIDIDQELEKIRVRNADVGSTTLLKADTLRVVLMGMKAGARLHEHHADGRLLLQVLEGEVEFAAENQKQTLGAGTLASVEAMVPHAVVALRESVLLLTIAWPQQGPVSTASHRNTGYK